MNYWKKWFPTVFMWWIQISNHFCYLYIGRFSNSN